MSTLTPNPTSTSESEQAADWWAVIVRTPGTCSGQARIAGTRIKVKHVFRWIEELGQTPAKVVELYPHLTRAQIYAALAYYWAHQDEIHGEIDDEDQLIAELQSKSGPSKLQARLSELNAQSDPLSSR